MADHESKTGSKLHQFTTAVMQALRAESIRSPARDSQPPSGKSKAPSERISQHDNDDRSSRTWDPEEWEEDQRYVEAMQLLDRGHKRDAQKKLIGLFEDDPNHLYGRRDLFALSLELGDQEITSQHADWIIGYFTQQQEHASACKAYRDARVALPNLSWTEKALVQALIAGDKTKDGRVVVDATKLLLQSFPHSAALARAFIASADVQLNEGRADLAKVTLHNVIARFPLDPLVPMAERKLADLG